MTTTPDPKHPDPKTAPEPEDTRFHLREAAQASRMAQVKNVQNPQVLHKANPPNAGGQNREAGDRRARQNDRATNGGE